MAKIQALLDSPTFVAGCQSLVVVGFSYWAYNSQQAQSAKPKQEYEQEFKKREQERDQRREELDRQFKESEAECDQLFEDWKRRLKQNRAERERERRETRYAFSKHLRENGQLIWAILRTCANYFEFERVFREWKEQKQNEAMDSL